MVDQLMGAHDHGAVVVSLSSRHAVGRIGGRTVAGIVLGSLLAVAAVAIEPARMTGAEEGDPPVPQDPAIEWESTPAAMVSVTVDVAEGELFELRPGGRWSIELYRPWVAGSPSVSPWIGGWRVAPDGPEVSNAGEVTGPVRIFAQVRLDPLNPEMSGFLRSRYESNDGTRYSQGPLLQVGPSVPAIDAAAVTTTQLDELTFRVTWPEASLDGPGPPAGDGTVTYRAEALSALSVSGDGRERVVNCSEMETCVLSIRPQVGLTWGAPATVLLRSGVGAPPQPVEAVTIRAVPFDPALDARVNLVEIKASPPAGSGDLVRVERSYEGGNWEWITPYPGGTLFGCPNCDLTSNVQFRVVAYNAFGSATPVPLAAATFNAADFVVQSTGNLGEVLATWTPPIVAGVPATYALERKQGARGRWVQQGAVDTSSTRYSECTAYPCRFRVVPVTASQRLQPGDPILVPQSPPAMFLSEDPAQSYQSVFRVMSVVQVTGDGFVPGSTVSLWQHRNGAPDIDLFKVRRVNAKGELARPLTITIPPAWSDSTVELVLKQENREPAREFEARRLVIVPDAGDVVDAACADGNFQRAFLATVYSGPGDSAAVVKTLAAELYAIDPAGTLDDPLGLLSCELVKELIDKTALRQHIQSYLGKTGIGGIATTFGKQMVTEMHKQWGGAKPVDAIGRAEINVAATYTRDLFGDAKECVEGQAPLIHRCEDLPGLIAGIHNE